MTAKEYLLQHKLMKIRIKNAEDSLAELRETRASMSVNLDGMPRGSALSDRTAALAVQLADAETELLSLRSAAWSLCMEIVRTINRLEDPAEVRLLHLRYIECLTWERIAVEMGFTYQWVAGPLHGRALQSLEKVLNEGGEHV